MRILHILNHTNRLNGHVHAAVDLACAQVQLGHSVCVASGGGDFDQILHKNNVTTVMIDHHRKPIKLLKSSFALRKHVNLWRPDVIHAHMMTSAVLAWPICRLSGVPLVTTVHNEFEKSAILMGLGNRVIAVSDAVGASMRKRGIPSSRLRVVLNGTIGSVRSNGRGRNPVVMTSPSILFVGGLHPRKGLPDLFEAFCLAYKEHPQARLHIVGDGPFHADYRSMVADMGCASAVEFLGAKEDPFPWMMAADIFVLPSHADPAPLVLSEAREAGCAIIGSSVDGIPQLLEYGAAGMLVPPHDPIALAAALCHLLENPAHVREWKDKSQVHIERLTINRVARETLDVYGGVLPKNNKSASAAA